MPFKSEAQKRWMHKNRPDIARRWAAKEASGEYKRPVNLPDRTTKTNAAGGNPTNPVAQAASAGRRKGLGGWGPGGKKQIANAAKKAGRKAIIRRRLGEHAKKFAEIKKNSQSEPGI